jgi:integrase/recombinase XerD
MGRRPPRLPQIGPAGSGLSALAAQFLDWQQTLVGEASLYHYTRSVGTFLRWCNEAAQGHLETPAGLNRELIGRYVDEIEDACDGRTGKPLGYGTKTNRLFVVRQFCKWLVVHGYLGSNPAAGARVRSRPERHKHQPVLTAEEAERVLAQPDVKTPRGLRDRAFLELLYSTGLRRQEMATLDVADVRWTPGSVHVRQGKGMRDRVVPVGDRAVEWLGRYVEQCRRTWVRYDAGRLFLSLQGQPLGVDELSELVRRSLDAAGIEKRGCCHLFRRSMAAGMLDGGADIGSVQAMLGHMNVSTTMLYTPVTFESLQRVYEENHPDGRGVGQSQTEQPHGQG